MAIVANMEPSDGPSVGAPPKLKVKLQLGEGRVFEAEGDFSFDEGFQAALRSFINAISETPGQLEALNDRGRAAVARLRTSTAENTPQQE